MATLFDSNEVRRMIQGFNPWWAGKPVAAPKFQRLAFGVCLRQLEDKSSRRAILLSGPRRVGKTTILVQLAESLIKKGRHPNSADR